MFGRFDRAMTVRVVWPVIRNRESGGAGAIPVLMYHSISADLDGSRAPYYRTVTSPRTFAAHLRLLKSGGFVTVSLSRAVEILRHGAVKPEGTPVVITFDDGLEDFYLNAFPLLEAEGSTATVFLSSGFINGVFPTGHACMSVSQVRELSRHGIEFGSHSVTHVHLVDQTRQRLERELADSKAAIEAILGREITLFSYPYRFPSENKAFVDYLQERLQANGYQAGVTTTVGRASASEDVMFLPRLPVNDCDDDEFLGAKLRGGYDWFGRVQRIYKVLRSGVTKSHARSNA